MENWKDFKLSSLAITHHSGFTARDCVLMLVDEICGLNKGAGSSDEHSRSGRPDGTMDNSQPGEEVDSSSKYPAFSNPGERYQFRFEGAGDYAPFLRMSQGTFRDANCLVDSTCRLDKKDLEGWRFLQGASSTTREYRGIDCVNLFLNTFCDSNGTYRGVSIEKILKDLDPIYSEWSLAAEVVTRALNSVPNKKREEAQKIPLARFEDYRSRGLIFAKYTEQDIDNIVEDLDAILEFVPSDIDITEWPLVKQNQRILSMMERRATRARRPERRPQERVERLEAHNKRARRSATYPESDSTATRSPCTIT
ncbi:LAMI_0D12442g1_1 [Lachancea mirantina]|uniref:LAMI_0D12442g1_1 n=1 Tax=Lachancea mirantina TaxID=1230905 RepID=A0A1G4JFN4_9SACH|nr:LAMI_0D12442g1_1 [Lachancea mirantina]